MEELVKKVRKGDFVNVGFLAALLTKIAGGGCPAILAGR